MATWKITTDTNMDAVGAGAWNSNDLFIITGGATVTVNTDQSKYWSNIAIDDGKLKIINTSTASGITFAMGRNIYANYAFIYPNGGLSSVEISGNWITFGTSNGLPNQTMTAPFRDAISAVWVETGLGTDIFVPWLQPINNNAGWNRSYSARLDAVGSGNCGNFFYQDYNNDNRYCYLEISGCTTATGSKTVLTANNQYVYPGAMLSGVGLAATSILFIRYVS